nr:hypothetical protein [Gammaproteobacteria bacterium]
MSMIPSDALRMIKSATNSDSDSDVSISEDLQKILVGVILNTPLRKRTKVIFFHLTSYDHRPMVIAGLRKLFTRKDLNIFTAEICTEVIKASGNASTLADAVIYLATTNKALLTNEVLTTIRLARSHAIDIAATIVNGDKLNASFINLEIRQILLKTPWLCKSYAEIFLSLRRCCGKKEVALGVLKKIIALGNMRDIKRLNLALSNLQTKHEYLLADVNFIQVLINSGKDAVDLVDLFIKPMKDISLLNRLINILSRCGFLDEAIITNYLKLDTRNLEYILLAITRLRISKLFTLGALSTLLENLVRVNHIEWFSSLYFPHCLGLQTESDVSVRLQALDLQCLLAENTRELAKLIPGLPPAESRESVMDHKRTEEAKENFKILGAIYGKKLVTDLHLNELEKELRLALLEDIKADLEESSASLAIAIEPLRGINAKLLDFLSVGRNRQLLADRTSPEINRQARALFISKSEPAIIAYRLYDSSGDYRGENYAAPSVTLLRAPPLSDFSENGLPGTFLDCSNYVRRYILICFLASKDLDVPEEKRKSIWQYLKFYLAEIMRAHSKSITDSDGLSCFIGCINRLSIVASMHPNGINTFNTIELIQNKIQSIIARELTWVTGTEHSESVTDQEQLIYSLTMLGPHNIPEIVRDPSRITTVLGLVEDIGNPDTHDYILSCKKRRANFLSNLNIDLIYEEVLQYLRERKVVMKDYIFYIVIECLLGINKYVTLTTERRSILEVQSLSTEIVSETEHFFSGPTNILEDIDRYILTLNLKELSPEQQTRARNRLRMQDYWVPLFKKHEYDRLT